MLKKLVEFSGKSNQNKYSISPFMCCDRGVHIFGRNDELKFKAIADCCQMGLVCGTLPCEPC